MLLSLNKIDHGENLTGFFGKTTDAIGFFTAFSVKFCAIILCDYLCCVLLCGIITFINAISLLSSRIQQVLVIKLSMIRQVLPSPESNSSCTARFRLVSKKLRQICDPHCTLFFFS